MKLLLCRRCSDVFKLQLRAWRFCECGAVGGRYLDEAQAEYGGRAAVPLGIADSSVISALVVIANDCLQSGRNERDRFLLKAFVIKLPCPTFVKAPLPKPPKPPKAPQIQLRLLEMIISQPECWCWSSGRFADELGCSGPAIRKTAVWQILQKQIKSRD